MDVSSERIPDNTDADITRFQSTLFITTAVPIIAAAVCAIVLMARIPAALPHFIILFLNNTPSFLYIKKAFAPKM